MGGNASWDPQTLNRAVTELRREFPSVLPERILRVIDLAARSLLPEVGYVRLLQQARETLRTDR